MASRNGEIASAFPKPGPALKWTLIVIATVGVVNAVLYNWVSGGGVLFQMFACSIEDVLRGQVWRLVTAGVLTHPKSFQHLFFTLVGLYFLSTDLERRWGSWRFVRFLLASTVTGFALATLLYRISPLEIFHVSPIFGAGAAISATATAWSRENADKEVRLFFVLPVRGRMFLWLTVAYCVAGIVFHDFSSEGAAAPFGGIVVGLLMSGSPSAIRALYLRMKLASLRSRVPGMPTAAELARPDAPRLKRRGGAPLRVVQGGLDDELKKRNPPKDKRYLN